MEPSKEITQTTKEGSISPQTLIIPPSLLEGIYKQSQATGQPSVIIIKDSFNYHQSTTTLNSKDDDDKGSGRLSSHHIPLIFLGFWAISIFTLLTTQSPRETPRQPNPPLSQPY